PPTPSPARHSPLGESLLLGGLIVAGAAAVALLGPERERIAGADARPAPALPRIAVAARGDPPLASSA
ncbi:MAG: hypothetical protein GWM92_12285, partial [Gemmatimonadetes bacterium]|nr:hypothetical protein [Gemmatimonadota bacterium]NIR79475.1 hypothetical protein [Gemmatimonadota bacterium]NIT88145.1 hypothetical protein [Gemmatimonadota bacterium]NIU31967.1 hypothetical protein [Gemmatimonadota bacterium]NIU36579.1 hypothetical protein [Gemmatimonadota bacterium]